MKIWTNKKTKTKIMKTQKLFLTLAVVMLGLVSLQASEGREVTSAKQQLKSEIKSLFYYVPFEDLITNDEYCILRVEFTINDSQQMENIVVEGNNADLVQYVKTLLSKNKIIADDQLVGRMFGVNLKFVYRS
jgi:hypothetical protein